MRLEFCGIKINKMLAVKCIKEVLGLNTKEAISIIDNLPIVIRCSDNIDITKINKDFYCNDLSGSIQGYSFKIQLYEESVCPFCSRRITYCNCKKRKELPDEVICNSIMKLAIEFNKYIKFGFEEVDLKVIILSSPFNNIAYLPFAAT